MRTHRNEGASPNAPLLQINRPSLRRSSVSGFGATLSVLHADCLLDAGWEHKFEEVRNF